MTLPNFLIVGTARSGTTSLYYYLRQHPDICFPAIKEPKYFSSIRQKYPHLGPGDRNVDSAVVRDFHSYQKLFESCTSCYRIGDASSDYLFHHVFTASEIFSVLGDIPIVICLRNPVDRAWSAYNNLVRDQREELSFQDALYAEEKRLENNWDWMWAYKKAGLYADQVSTFMQKFSNIHIVIFDDLQQDPGAVVRNLFGFLDVDDSVVIDTSIRYSYSGKARNSLVAFLSDRENVAMYLFRKFLLKYIPRSFFEQMAPVLLERNEMSVESREYLKKYFSNDINRLGKIIHRSMEDWL